MAAFAGPPAAPCKAGLWCSHGDPCVLYLHGVKCQKLHVNAFTVNKMSTRKYQGVLLEQRVCVGLNAYRGVCVVELSTQTTRPWS